MIDFFKGIVVFINKLHDFLLKSSSGMGMGFNDKQLHFMIMAMIGMVIYFVVNKVFKALAKYSVSILSFIYTFTVLLVITFAIEIEQKITKRGNMEFADIVAGVWGFIVVFFVYIIIYGLFLLIKKSIKNARKKPIEKSYKEPGRARHISKEKAVSSATEDDEEDAQEVEQETGSEPEVKKARPWEV